MPSKRIHIILPIILSIMATLQAHADVVVNAALADTVIQQGGRTALRIEIVRDIADKGQMVNMPPMFVPDSTGYAPYGRLEVFKVEADSTDLGNGRRSYVYNFALQAFEPGNDMTDPMHGIVSIPGPGWTSEDGTETVSEPLTLKVIAVDVNAGDPENPEALIPLNPDEGTRSVPKRWYDFIPDSCPWWLAGIAVVIAAIVAWCIVRRRKKRRRAGIMPKRKVEPPYVVAMRRLEKLRRARLAENGQEKEYYTRLTDILRQYLEGRFGINAMEMTSRQIIDTVNASPETALAGEPLKELLEMADFVKFAKVRPLTDENVKSFNSVVAFVEETKPRPQEDKKPAEADKSKTNPENATKN